MGQDPSPAQAWPGALGPTLGERLKPGLQSKVLGLKGPLEYDFPLRNWHYFGKF